MKPDLTSVRSALTSIIESKDPERKLTIIMESTVQPGTTRNCVIEIIGNQDIENAGLMISYCPERVSPGEEVLGWNRSEESLAQIIQNLPKSWHICIISLQSEALHQSIQSKSPKHQSWSRTLKGTSILHSSTNFQFFLPKLGLDVEKVLEAADTKWNFHRHTPGLGVGGHCIPIDPHYYIEIAESIRR